MPILTQYVNQLDYFLTPTQKCSDVGYYILMNHFNGLNSSLGKLQWLLDFQAISYCCMPMYTSMSDMWCQKAAIAYFWSKQLLHFAFAVYMTLQVPGEG